MKFSYIALTVLLSAIVAFGVVKMTPTTTAQETKKETAFERVMRTGTLRCAYALAGKPRFIPDPNTGTLKGTNVEIMEAVGRILNLKIIWDEQVNYGIFPENLRSGKQDAFCSTVWNSSARAHKVLMAKPIQFTPVYVYVRKNDTRFDNSLATMNKKAISFSVMEGTTLDSVIKVSFPKATRHSLPLSAGATDTIMDVATGKADATIFDDSNIAAYNKQNPTQTLRRVPSKAPVRIYGEAFSVAMGEWELRELLNTAIGELQNNGTIDRILKKYEKDYGKVMRSQGPYIPVKD